MRACISVIFSLSPLIFHIIINILRFDVIWKNEYYIPFYPPYTVVHLQVICYLLHGNYYKKIQTLWLYQRYQINYESSFNDLGFHLMDNTITVSLISDMSWLSTTCLHSSYIGGRRQVSFKGDCRSLFTLEIGKWRLYYIYSKDVFKYQCHFCHLFRSFDIPIR